MAVAKTITEAPNSCRLELIPYFNKMAGLRDRTLTKTLMTAKKCEDSKLLVQFVTPVDKVVDHRHSLQMLNALLFSNR